MDQGTHGRKGMDISCLMDTVLDFILNTGFRYMVLITMVVIFIMSTIGMYKKINISECTSVIEKLISIFIIFIISTINICTIIFLINQIQKT